MTSYPPPQPQPPFPGMPLPGYGQFPQQPQPMYQAYGPRVHTEPAAAVALTLGLVSYIIPVVPGIVAFFLAVGAKRNIKASNGLRSGRGMATAAEILGATSTLLFAIILAITYFVTSR